MEQHQILTLQDLLAGVRGKIKPRAVTKLGTVATGEDTTKLGLTPNQHRDVAVYGPKVDLLTISGFGEKVWTRVYGKNWVGVLLILPGDMIPLVGEYLHGIDEVHLTVPSGVIEDSKETPEERAAIEAEEETGFAVKSVTPLGGGVSLSPRRSPERSFPFIAYPKTDDQGKALMSNRTSEPDEEIEVFLVHIKDLFSWVTHADYKGSIGLRDITLRGLIHLKRMILVS